MDGFGLVDRRTADLLLQAGPLALAGGRERDRTAALGRAVERADDAHVGQPLFGAGLGLAVVQHAVREVEQLGRELVALGEAPLVRLAVDA